MKKAEVLKYSISAQQRLIRQVDAQADLSLCLAQDPKYLFCHAAAHYFLFMVMFVCFQLRLQMAFVIIFHVKGPGKTFEMKCLQ